MVFIVPTGGTFVVPASSGGGGGGGGGVAPTGSLLDWGADLPAPSGWLLCDGTVYNISDYPALGALYGSKYGGNGTTTFAVPDPRSRYIVTVGPGGGGLSARTLGQTGGAESVTLSAGNLPAHDHAPVGITDPGHLHTLPIGSPTGGTDIVVSNQGVALPGQTVNTSSSTTGVSATPTSVGSGTAVSTVNPFFGLYKIVKT